MGKRTRSGSMGSASAKKRRRMGNRYYARKPYRPTYVRPGYGAIGRTPGGGVIGEMKYFDTHVSGGQVPVNNGAWANTTIDPSTFNTLCVPTVGAAYNQRIGKEINIVKLKIRGVFTVNNHEAQALSVPATTIRYGIFQDMQTNATQANASLVMTPTLNNFQAPFTFQNIDNFGRFKVLKDKVCTIQDPNMAGTDTVHDVNARSHTFKMTLKFNKPIQVRFNNTNGGTIADIIDNSLHFFANSNCNNVNFQPVVNYLCRVCYKE